MTDLRRHALIGLAVLVPLGVTMTSSRTSPPVYNSDEHRLIVDRGVAAVVVPPSIRFPAGIATTPVDTTAYVGGYRAAKELAVGFETNNPADFDSRKGHVQDNCYYTATSVGGLDIPFHQAAYNKLIRIPSREQVPATILNVPAYNAAASLGRFTMGQLAALYGDYRRTTHCDASGRCFLTNADVDHVVFARGNAIQKSTYCPAALHAGRYLQHIGSGLVPPTGGLGNTTGNTASDDEYGEAGWWGDEMLRIANVNDWHFSSAAISWYVGLHRLALLYADSARADPRHWARALHYEANALHSLTDLFAFGHVVTNRDETAFGIMKPHARNQGYRWMENVIRMGGGSRSESGRISLSNRLPAIADVASVRNDFVKSDRGTWVRRAENERRYHDALNASGAQVRNLNGDDFQIFGDAKLAQMMNGEAVTVIANAVTASVQALFDAHVELQQRTGTVESIGAARSPYFAALKYVPVFIVRDANGYFPGMWTRYAQAAADISGSDRTIASRERCQVAYLSGSDGIAWPDKPSGPCTSF